MLLESLDRSSEKVPLPQLIIALLLVKSRPTNIALKGIQVCLLYSQLRHFKSDIQLYQDYLAELRSHIKQGRRPKDTPASHVHLCATGFWKDAHNKSEEMNHMLRARIAELEGRIEHYKDPNTLQFYDEVQDRDILQRKRKRASADPATRSDGISKLARLANSGSTMQARQKKLHRPSHVSRSATPALVSNPTETHANAFLHHIYVLQQMKSDPSTTPEKLIATFDGIFTNIRQVIASVNDLEDDQLVNDSSVFPARVTSNTILEPQEPPSSNVRILSRTLPLLMNALDNMTQLELGSVSQGPVIYMFVNAFRQTVERVCQLSTTHGREETFFPETLNMSAGTQQKQPIRNAIREADTLSFTPSEALLSLCELAVAIMTNLDTTKQAHYHILEGCLAVLIAKVGSGLRLALARDTFEQDQKEAQLDLKVKGACLIFILERAPELRENQAGRLPNSTLTETVKTKLQNTMLNAVFGDRGRRLLKPVLDSQELTAGPLGYMGIEAAEVRNWYLYKVWKLVGWETLQQHLGVTRRKKKAALHMSEG